MFNRNKKRNRIVAAVIVVILVLTMVLSLVVSVRADEIPSASLTGVKAGVTLNGEDVSGMNRSQLRARAEGIIEDMRQARIVIRGRDEGQEAAVFAGNLGLYWENPEVVDECASFGRGANLIRRYKQKKDAEINGSNFTVKPGFDRDTIVRFLEENCLPFNTEPVEASLTRENGQFIAHEGVTGYVIDLDGSADKILEFLENEWAGKSIELDLVAEEIAPKTTAEEISQMTALLGTYTTYYSSSSEERCTNIANGCRLISGHTLKSGEEFSVLQHLVPFTEANGYQPAGSYIGDEVVDSLGGGICQVSTTLYNAVIRAELEITRRSNHSMIVGYVDPSADAAIAESTGMDLRFVNNTDYPVFIEGTVYNKSITFNIYGVEKRSPSRRISFESETLETIPTEGIDVRGDATKPVGEVKSTAGHTGYVAQLWKIVTEDGQEISREIFNKSTYQMTPQIITVGTAGTVTDELKEAMESKSLDRIKTAAANAKRASENTGVNTDGLTEAAQAAAQEAYADALAEGKDTTSAQEIAQQAANDIVAQQAAAPAETYTDDDAASAAIEAIEQGENQ